MVLSARKDLKPYIKIDGEGYVNLVSAITEVLEENEMSEEKKRTIAENNRQRDDFEVKKAKVLEELHHEVEDYLTQESTVKVVNATS